MSSQQPLRFREPDNQEHTESRPAAATDGAALSAAQAGFAPAAAQVGTRESHAGNVGVATPQGCPEFSCNSEGQTLDHNDGLDCGGLRIRRARTRQIAEVDSNGALRHVAIHRFDTQDFAEAQAACLESNRVRFRFRVTQGKIDGTCMRHSSS